MKALTESNRSIEHRETRQKAGSYRRYRAEAAQYELCSYPLAWALIEDPTTGVPRAASRDELIALGLAGPKFEAEMREVFRAA